MAEFITEADLASYLQRDIEVGAGDYVVGLANGLVTDEWGELTPVPTRVTTIVLEVAARGFRNPEGYSSEQTSIDDYDKIVRREGPGMQVTGVYLTDEEKAEIAELRNAALGTAPRRRRVGSIRLRVPDVS